MSLPASWTQVPVTGTYTYRDGTPAAGRKIKFESDQVVAIGGETIVPKTITVRLGESGAIPAGFTLPSTNDPELDVTGWAYTVREMWPGGRNFDIFVPYDSAGIDMAEVSPAVDPDALLSIEAAALATGLGAAATAAKVAAQAAQAAAETASTASAGSATASATSASAAATSATSAGGSASAAATSETNAGNSATAAAGSASTAATDATTAGSASTAAQAAQAAAETAQGAAETAATNAGNSATAAAASESAAAALIAGTALLRHGTGAPSNALGNDGDYYLDDTAPKTLYGPKAAGAWPAGVSLQGAAGSDAVWTQITQAAYDALNPPDPATLYVIMG